MTNEDVIKIARSVFAHYARTNNKISWEDRNNAYGIIIKALEQEPKTEQWIKKEIVEKGDFSTVKTYRSVCSNCGIVNISKYKNYCPNCGCRMIKPQESEDNE